MPKIVRATDFVATIGVDTHIPYTDGGYANIANVEADLAYLGITGVRDGISNGQSGSAPLSSYISLAEKGIKFTFCIAGSGAITTASMQATLALIAQLNATVPGSVAAVEGVNEINNSGVTYNGVGGLAGALALQRDLYAAVKSNAALTGVAVDYFTGYNAGSIAVGPNPATTAGLANYDTQHPYPVNGEAPAAFDAPAAALGNETAPFGPAVYTETGYSTNGVSPDVQAKYTLDLLMDDAANGIVQTDLYQLLDAYQPGSTQGDDGYGLFGPNNAPKEAATAIHNLVAILADTGATRSVFATTAASYSVVGLPSTGNSLLIEKSSGAQDIAVWNEPQIWNQATGTEITAPATTVTVELGATYQTVEVFDPLSSSSPIETLKGVSSVQLSLTDHPLIVEVEPGQSSAGTVAGGVSTPAGASNVHITGSVSGNVLSENGAVLYNWNPATQLPNWIAAETAVANGTPGVQAKIIAFGDSTTAGVGAADGLSYPDDLAKDLAQDSGIPTQSVDFYGDQADTSQVSFVGGGGYNYGLNGAGAAMAQLAAPGQGIVWTPLESGTFNRLDLSYWDNGNGSVTVTAIGGPDGTYSQTVQFANSGNMMTQTIDLPEGSYSQVSVVSNSANASFIEGMSFWDSNTPAIQVINAGEGGAWASVVGNGQSTGTGEFPGGVALKPSLALIDYGLNDILNNTYTTAQTVANIGLMVTECRANGCDPIIVIPEPFGLDPSLANNLSSISQLITGLEALSIQMNVPIIDLNSTYGNSPTTYASGALIGFGVHPSADGYADIAERIASVLTNTAQSYANTTSYVVPGAATVTGTNGNDVLFSTGTSNTLVGDGGNDTYLMNPNDQTDTIVNGVSGGAQPLGQLVVIAANHQQLWFTKSGTSLVVQILGTAKQAIIQGWYGGAWAQLQQIVAGDGYQISNSAIQNLVQAMAAFAAANPSFNVGNTPYTALSDSYFAGVVATASSTDWTVSTTTSQSGTSQSGTSQPVAPPAAPGGVSLSAGSDSGTAGDGITNVTKPTFVGSATAGTTVNLYAGTTLIGTATASASGAWSISATLALAAGTYSLFATATSTAGSVSADSPTFSLTIDTQAPAAPAAPVLAAVSGDGVAGQTQSTTPTITGTAIAGDTVALYNGSTLLGTAIASTAGTWSITPTTALALGSHSLTATQTDVAGNVSAPSAALALSVINPPTPVTTTTPSSDTLVLYVADTAASGVNAEFTVSVDGTQVGGVQTATAAEAAGGGQAITLTGNFGAAGAHDVTVTYLNGFTGAAADAGRMLFINAVSLDGLAISPDSRMLFDSSNSYTLQKPATPVASNAGTQDTLILNLSETAVSSQDALFMVSVDGQIVGGIQSVTASHAAGQTQNVTLTGDFGSGAHTVAINFLNGFGGNQADAGRTLYVNSISLDGHLTTENASQFYIGATAYGVNS
jgi:lysophospholipase L1-like esterase